MKLILLNEPLSSSGCPALLFFLFFPIFSELPIFSYIFILIPIFLMEFLYFSKCCSKGASVFNSVRILV